MVFLVSCNEQPAMPSRPPGSAAALASPAQAAGCYRVELGRWREDAKDDATLWTLPAAIALTTRPATVPLMSKEWMAIESRAASAPRRWSRWRLVSGSVEMLWSDGFTGIEASARPHRGGLWGEAETFEDGAPRFHRHASIALHRIPCNGAGSNPPPGHSY